MQNIAVVLSLLVAVASTYHHGIPHSVSPISRWVLAAASPSLAAAADPDAEALRATYATSSPLPYVVRIVDPESAAESARAYYAANPSALVPTNTIASTLNLPAAFALAPAGSVRALDAPPSEYVRAPTYAPVWARLASAAGPMSICAGAACKLIDAADPADVAAVTSLMAAKAEGLYAPTTSVSALDLARKEEIATAKAAALYRPVTALLSPADHLAVARLLSAANPKIEINPLGSATIMEDAPSQFAPSRVVPTGAYAPPLARPGAYAPPSAHPSAYAPAPTTSGAYAPAPAPAGAYAPPLARPGAYAPPSAPPSAYAPASAPAGVYTPASAPAGAYSSAPAASGAYAPAPAPAGAYAPASSPAGAYAPAPAPAGAYAPASALAGAYAPAAAPAGAYTSAPAAPGAYAPASSPAGAYAPASAAPGAYAPASAPAGAYAPAPAPAGAYAPASAPAGAYAPASSGAYYDAPAGYSVSSRLPMALLY